MFHVSSGNNEAGLNEAAGRGGNTPRSIMRLRGSGERFKGRGALPLDREVFNPLRCGIKVQKSVPLRDETLAACAGLVVQT